MAPVSLGPSVPASGVWRSPGAIFRRHSLNRGFLPGLGFSPPPVVPDPATFFPGRLSLRARGRKWPRAENKDSLRPLSIPTDLGFRRNCWPPESHPVCEPTGSPRNTCFSKVGPLCGLLENRYFSATPPFGSEGRDPRGRGSRRAPCELGLRSRGALPPLLHGHSCCNRLRNVSTRPPHKGGERGPTFFDSVWSPVIGPPGIRVAGFRSGQDSGFRSRSQVGFLKSSESQVGIQGSGQVWDLIRSNQEFRSGQESRLFGQDRVRPRTRVRQR